MIDIYGIKNCNTVKKSLEWFESRNIPYTFHDFKKEGVTTKKLSHWEAHFGWETLLNKRGTTWRKLPAERQQQITDATSALKLLEEQTSMIKRPVVEASGGQMSLGFDEASFQDMIK